MKACSEAKSWPSRERGGWPGGGGGGGGRSLEQDRDRELVLDLAASSSAFRRAGQPSTQKRLAERERAFSSGLWVRRRTWAVGLPLNW